MAGILFEQAYKSGLERKGVAQFNKHGVKFAYESVRIPYTVPERQAHYIPDFPFPEHKILIEFKGRFGHHKSDANGAAERQKLILVKEQHPEWDVRIVFQDANKKIYKGSPTNYAKWATDHGFKFSDKGIVPAEWIEELKRKPTKR